MSRDAPTARAAASPGAPARAGATRRLLQRLASIATLCVAIALLLTALDGHGFATKLVYSLSIGGAFTLCIETTRWLVAAASRARRRRRGEAVPASPRLPADWTGVAPGVAVALLVAPALGLQLADALTGGRSPSLLDWANPSTRVTLALGVLGTLAAVAGAVSRERLANARAQAEAAQRQAAENQLRLLQSQLEPHMLFNTLANLRVLIGLDSPRAQAMLDHLIAFLRSTLQASRADAHPLAAEFDRLGDYLALMAVRMGPRLRWRLDLPEALRAVPVPPLLLQPLVENAIRHGLEPQVAGGEVVVEAVHDAGGLTLRVTDTGAGLRETVAGPWAADAAVRDVAGGGAQPPPRRAGGAGAGAAGAGAVAGAGAGHGAGPAAAAAASTGFGLGQVRQRLHALHGERAGLVLAPGAGGVGTVATVRLPWPAAGGPPAPAAGAPAARAPADPTARPAPR